MASDQIKLEQALAVEKKYGKRKNFKHIRNKAHREIYREEILQPIQRQFRDVYAKQAKIREAIDRTGEEDRIQKAKDLDEIYAKSQKNILTIEQKVLKDIKTDHPTMVSEEDILKWHSQTKTK